ncbi:MAG: glycosyltransferase [Acidobacteria bacterium]|nr:glycosyltransferase [Acidobacteriota bacterium]
MERAIPECGSRSIAEIVLVGNLDLCEILLPIWKERGGPEIVEILTPGRPGARRFKGLAVGPLQSPLSKSVNAFLLNLNSPEEERKAYALCRTCYPEAPIFSLWSTDDHLNFHHELSERAQALAKRCLEEGVSPIAVFGAGSHTRFLLREWKGKRGPAVACILTSKKNGISEIEGIPVKQASRFRPVNVRAVVVSSHSHETELYRLCRGKWPDIPVLGVWRSAEELQSWSDLENLARCVISECAADGVQRVAIYGAGEYAQNLLSVWRGLSGPEVVGAVVTKTGAQERLLDLPVTSIDSLDPDAVDGIVLSSKSFEMEMAETCMKRWPLKPFYPLWNPTLRLSAASMKCIIPNAIHRCRIKAVQTVALFGTGNLLSVAESWWRKFGGPEITACIKAIPYYDADGVRSFRPETLSFNPDETDGIVVLNSPDSAGLLQQARVLWPESSQISAWLAETEMDTEGILSDTIRAKSKIDTADIASEIAYQSWRSGQVPVEDEKPVVSDPKRQFRVKFGFFGVVGNSPSPYIREMLKSVVEQSYPNWELSLCVSAREENRISALVREVADGDPRIRVRSADASHCAWTGLRTAFEDTSSEFVIPLGHMDALSPDALLRVSRKRGTKSRWDILICAERDPGAGCIESKIPAKLDCSAFCGMPHYGVAALTVIRRSRLDSAWPKKRNTGCYLDFARVMQQLFKTSRVQRISNPLYFWRCAPGARGIRFSGSGKRPSSTSVVIISRPMKVALDARLLHRKTTGTERYISILLDGFEKFHDTANIELTVLLKQRPKSLPPRAKAVLNRHADAIRTADIFHRTIQAYDAEALKEMAGARACVYTIHDLISYIYGDYMPSDRAFQTYRKVARAGAHLASHIITVSDHAKQEIIRAFEIPDNSISSVANTLIPGNETQKSPGKTGSSRLRRIVPRKYFLLVGTDYPHKNLLGLLRAYGRVRMQLNGIKIVSAGVKYHQKPQPELKAVKLSLGDDFVDLGFVSDEDLAWLYDHAVAFIFPSMYEGFGYPPLEAMSHGTPVAASNAASIPEVTGSAALLFDGRDRKSMAQALIDISTDKALRSRLVRRGFARIRHFTLEKTMSGTMEAYFKGWRQSVERRLAPSAAKSHPAASGHSQDTILFVTHVPIWAPAAGNEIRLFNLIRYLKSRNHAVAMVYCPLDGGPVPESARAEISKYIDHFYSVSETEKRQAESRPSVLYKQLRSRQEPGILKWLATEDAFCPEAAVLKTIEALDTLNPRVLVAEYIWMSRILKLAGPGCLRVIDLHDKFSDKSSKVTPLGIEDSLAVTEDEEAAFLSRCDIAVAIQDAEARAFRRMEVQPLVITAGVDFPAIANRDPKNRELVVLIVASGNHLNVKCIQDFITESWPSVRKSMKCARLRIIGGVCGSLRTSDRTIHLAGYRQDLSAEYGRAHVVVNPVAAGTGLKIKSIEALSHGKPLVATAEAVEGIPVKNGTSCLVGHHWEDLAEKILTVLEDGDLRRSMGHEAHLFAAQWLSADRVYGELMRCLSIFTRP